MPRKPKAQSPLPADKTDVGVKRPPGRPRSTGRGKAKLVAWKPSDEERQRLEREAEAAGCSVNELSRRRTLGLPDGGGGI